MEAEIILEKYWKKFRLAIGLSYEPMSGRAKEYLLLAMEEYKNQVDKND